MTGLSGHSGSSESGGQLGLDTRSPESETGQRADQVSGDRQSQEVSLRQASGQAGSQDTRKSVR